MAKEKTLEVILRAKNELSQHFRRGSDSVRVFSRDLRDMDKQYRELTAASTAAARAQRVLAEEIDKARTKALHTNLGSLSQRSAKGDLDRLKSELAGINTGAAAVDTARGELRRNAQARAGVLLERSKVALLAKQADLGNRQAAKALEVYRINERYLARKRELLTVIQSELASESQKAAALSQIRGARQIRSAELAGAAPKGLRQRFNYLFSDRATTALLKGAGAASIFSYAGAKLNGVLDKAQEIQQQVADGSLSVREGWEEAARALAKATPVFGTFFEAGQKIRSMLDGSADELARLNRQTAEFQRRMELNNERVRVAGEVINAAGGRGETLARQNLLGTLGGGQAIRARAEFEFQDAMKEVAALQERLQIIPEGPQFASQYQEAQDKIDRITAEATKRRSQMLDQAAKNDWGLIRDSQDRIAELRAKTQQDTLISQGKTIEAEIAATKFATEERIKQIKRVTEEQARQNPLIAGILNRQSQEQIEQIRQQGTAAVDALTEQGKREEEERTRRAEIVTRDVGQSATDAADQAKLRILRERARLGDSIARQQAEELEISMRFGRERRAINDELERNRDLLKDESLKLSNEQRAEIMAANKTLTGLLAGLNQEEALARQNGRGKQASLAGFEVPFKVFGRDQVLPDSDPAEETADNTARAADAAEKTNQMLTTVLTQLAGGDGPRLEVVVIDA